MADSFFFDSYAFFEIIRGNPNYEKYENSGVVTATLNLFEVYLGLLRQVNEEIAKKALDNYYLFAIEYDKEIIEAAAKLKHALNRRKLSMSDCIGYIMACRLNIRFLTGDEQFKDLENVEFVK